MDVQDNHETVSLASRCGKKLEGAFDGGVLTSLPVRRHRPACVRRTGRHTGDSGTLLLREVEASTGVLSRMVDALKRYLEQKLERVHIHFLNGSTSHCAEAKMIDS